MFPVCLVGVTASADVGHFRPMAERLARDANAQLEAKQPIRALESYVRLMHYDEDYAPATEAMVRVAQLLVVGKPQCLAGHRPEAALLFRYALGTPTVEKAARQGPSGLDPVAEARKGLSHLDQRAQPLSNSMGHRKGKDAQLPSVKEILTKTLERCHAAMPEAAAGHYERELGILSSEWQEPAQAALKKLLAARDQLGAEQRLGVVLAACSDSRDEGRSSDGPPPCEVLLTEWPDVAKGLFEPLLPLTVDLDPGWRRAAFLLLAREGQLKEAAASALRADLLKYLGMGDYELRDARALLPAFEGQRLTDHREGFESWIRERVGKLREGANPYPESRCLSVVYRAAYRMGPEGVAWVREVARTAGHSSVERAGAAWALGCGELPAELETLTPLAVDADGTVGEAVAHGVDECGTERSSAALLPMLKNGPPQVAQEAVRALKHLVERDVFKANAAPLLELAAAPLERTDLGKQAMYVQQDALEALRQCNDPAVVKTIVKLKTDDAYLLEKQLELVCTKAIFDPDTAEKWAAGYLQHPQRSIMRAAERAVDRALSEKKSRTESGR